MSACYNCRKSVFPTESRCPYCGITFQPGTWRTQTDFVSPNPAGWGLAAGTYKSLVFRVGSLLVPVWLPLVIARLSGPQPGGDAGGLLVLLGLFIFIPGVYVVANVTSWGKLLRFFACLVYVAMAEIVCYLSLTLAGRIWVP